MFPSLKAANLGPFRMTYPPPCFLQDSSRPQGKRGHQFQTDEDLMRSPSRTILHPSKCLTQQLESSSSRRFNSPFLGSLANNCGHCDDQN